MKSLCQKRILLLLLVAVPDFAFAAEADIEKQCEPLFAEFQASPRRSRCSFLPDNTADVAANDRLCAAEDAKKRGDSCAPELYRAAIRTAQLQKRPKYVLALADYLRNYRSIVVERVGFSPPQQTQQPSRT